MYFLKPGIKQDPIRRWNLPDRIFFGYGACHILAGMYLKKFPSENLKAVMVVPAEGFIGSHVFVTDGEFSFDFHGYSRYQKLMSHHESGWTGRYPGWSAKIIEVDFDLLDTQALNSRGMRGPDQYLKCPLKRTEAFIDRFDHHVFV